MGLYVDFDGSTNTVLLSDGEQVATEPELIPDPPFSSQRGNVYTNHLLSFTFTLPDSWGWATSSHTEIAATRGSVPDAAWDVIFPLVADLVL